MAKIGAGTLLAITLPAARARELFKPSTDAKSLVVKLEKKCFCFGFELFWVERLK